MAAEEKMKQGITRKDALRAERLEQGSLEVTKEIVRSAGWESFVETLWQDLRFATPMLRIKSDDDFSRPATEPDTKPPC
jgi:hypothetical protein